MSGPALTRADCGALLAMARRHARGRVEAEDLMQEALLAALSAGRRGGPSDRAWMAGVMRNLARMTLRSSSRRRGREAAALETAAEAWRPGGEETVPLDGLSGGLRVVAALALSGHTRAEIRYLLGISDEALRQRIMGVRRHFAGRGQPVPDGLPGLRGGLAFGSIRRGLLPVAQRLERGLATHDPDGHGIVLGKMRLPPHETRAGGNRRV